MKMGIIVSIEAQPTSQAHLPHTEECPTKGMFTDSDTQNRFRYSKPTWGSTVIGLTSTNPLRP